MKTSLFSCVIGVILAWPATLAGASDIVGGGPAASLSSTVFFLTSTTRDRIEFPEASLDEVLSFLQRTVELPAEFGVKLDYSRIPEPNAIRVKLVEVNLSVLQATSLLAEQAGATLQIEPGKLILLPKPESGKKQTESITPDSAKR